VAEHIREEWVGQCLPALVRKRHDDAERLRAARTEVPRGTVDDVAALGRDLEDGLARLPLDEGLPDNARDTVETCTPAKRAMSAILVVAALGRVMGQAVECLFDILRHGAPVQRSNGDRSIAAAMAALPASFG
jgi:hypothetical protein